MSSKRKFTYYNYGQLLSYNAGYNCVAGGRGIGKSFGIKERSIKDWFKKREQFFYLRRYKDEIGKSAPLFFDDIAHKFPFADFRVRGGVAESASAETRGQKKREWSVLGYFGALSVGQQYKSVPFPAVTKLIYDEFIIEKGNTVYLRDEVTAFNNFFNTVDRYQDKTKAFLLANAVSMDNPFFVEWHVRPDEGREWQTFHDGFIVVHLPDSDKFQAEVANTRFGQFLMKSSPEYAEYAISNKFADANAELVESKTADAKYRFTLETQRQTFGCWFDLGLGRWYITRKRPRGNERVFTLERSNMGEGKTYLEFGSKPLGALRTAFNHGRVWFDEPGTRNLFLDIFKR